jgi:hypothetical protein
LLLFCVAVFRFDQATGLPPISGRPGPAIVRYLAARPSTAGTYRVIYPEALLTLRIAEVAFLGALLMPMAVYRFLRLRKFPAPVFYFCFHGALSLLALLGVLITDSGTGRANPSGIEGVLACIPTCALWYGGTMGDWDPAALDTIFIGLSVVTLLSILILLVRMWPAWRAISTLERTAGSLQPTASPSDAARPDAAA